MRLFQSIVIISFLTLNTATTSAQQSFQPQFKSGGIQVVANRAIRNSNGKYVVTLVLTNVTNENLAIYGSGGAEIIGDTGDALITRGATGLPICLTDCQLTNIIIGLYVDPVVIDKGNSIIATFVFSGDAQSKSCSIDFSMLIYVAGLGNNSQVTRKEQWRAVTVGLPNVRIC